MSDTPCPCGSGLNYAQCCQALHLGKAVAGTAEQLMRSRYSAFAVGDADYLMKTLHPKSRQQDTLASLQQSISRQHWLQLNIVDTAAGGKNDTTGVVEFVAGYESDGQQAYLHERSRFAKMDGLWYYLDGEQLQHPNKMLNRLGRNQPCWCGSKKKFKKCHAN